MEAEFKYIFWNLTKSEIDLLNVLLNIVERNDAFANGDFDYISTYYVIETNMHELSSSLGFLELNIDHIIKTLNLLTRSVANIYYEDGVDILMESSSFIHKFFISSTNKDINKRLRLNVSTSIIKILRDNKRILEQMYKYDKYDLRSKYSRILYDLFTKKEKTIVEYEIDEFIKLIDFDLEASNIDTTWSRLSTNILKRVSDDLNKKANLYFEYSSVKNKIDTRVQTTKIRFDVRVVPELEEPDTYFTNEFLMKRKVAYYIERDVKQRIATQTRFKSKVIEDVEAYAASVRKDLERNSIEYESKVLLQEWVNNVKYKNTNHDGLVVLKDFTDVNHYTTVNNNFKLYDIDKKVELSSTAKETLSKIKDFFKRHGDYEIVESVDILKNCSISYTRG